MSQDTTDYKAWALHYASLGWHVFPLSPGSKVPMADSHGSSEATTDTAQIEEWWSATPQANIGMNPKLSGLYVFDMDPRNGGEQGYADLVRDHGSLDSPLRAVSGRGVGFHDYFSAKPDARYLGRPAKGCDGKHNGFVVLPPSIHPDTKQRYLWANEPGLPAWALPVAPAHLEKPVYEKPNRIARAVSPAELPAIVEALSFLDSEDNDTWIHAMASVKHWGDHADCEAEAYEAFCNWSATSENPKHVGNDWEIEKRWNSFNSYAENARTIASVFHEAQQKGFRPGPDAKAAFDLAQQLFGMAQAAPVAEAFNTPKPVEHVAGNYEPLSGLRVEQTHTMNDHLMDAGVLRDSVGVFRNHLGSFEGATHWWNGRCWEAAPDAELRRLIGIAMTSVTMKTSAGRIKGTLEVMQDQLPRYGQVDPASRWVFFENGVLDPLADQVVDHAPEFRNSRVLSVPFDPSATCPAWNAWLADIFCTEPERAQLLQEMIGWTLCREHLGIEKSMILIGPPRSGKGTIIRIIRALLGNGAGAFTLPTLDDNKVLSGLRGQNVSIDSDTSSPSRKNSRQIVGLFKAISSNEPVPVTLLYKQMPWQGSLNCKLLLAANSIPTLWDDSAATANRWVPLAFDRSFLDREDVGLADRLVQELPGIAVWAVQGLQRLIRNGRFTLPQSSRDELANMITSGSPIEHYVTDRLVVAKNQRVSDADLWRDYSKWYLEEGLEQMKRKDFLKALEDALRGRGVKRKGSLRIGDMPLRGFEGVSVATATVVPIGAKRS